MRKKNLILLLFCFATFHLYAQWSKVGDSANIYTEGLLEVINNELYTTVPCVDTCNPGTCYVCNIVKWDSITWTPVVDTYPLGGGYALALLWHNNEFYIGGTFIKIGKWDGSNMIILGDKGNFPLYDLEIFNGDVHVTGDFYDINGISNTRGIAKWDGTNWSSVGGGLAGGSTSTKGFAMLNYKNDLYVGGDFGLAGNVPVNCIARWDGTQWDSVETGIPYCAYVRSLIADTINDFLYAGGSLGLGVARWDGYVWTNTLGNGLFGNIYSLAIYHNELYAVGYFNATGGSGVAKWNGTFWEAVGGGTTPGYTIKACEVYKDELYVAGGFPDAGGDTSIKNIARWYSPPDTTCKFLQPIIESMLSLSTPNGVSDTFYYTDSVAVQFYNNIASSTTWQWDFGDGDTGSGKTPIHYYNAAGTYTISVIVNYPFGPNGPCIDTAYKTITLINGVVGVNDLQKSIKFKVYPNPAKREINIEVTSPPNLSPKGERSYIVRVKNSLGQKIFEKKFEKALKIDSSKFKTGIYVVEVCAPSPSGREGVGLCHSEKVMVE